MTAIFASRPAGLAVPGLAALLVLAGCGTYHVRADGAALNGEQAPPAWNGAVTVSSDPAGASCTVTRAGAQVAQITAPAQVRLERGNSPAEVSCTAPGRVATAVTLRPLRDFGVQHHQATGPMGSLNHAEDIRTGRVRRFFDVTVALPPASFATAAERDAWFAARAEAIRAAWTVQIGRAERSQDAMIDSAATLRGYMNEDLAALERQKAATTVARAARRR
ncbi:hypothetical protein GXW74_12180 [Roseomonas eburnea]|uniref:Uncharacterized protein n=1 Tax=Neoroseomonas eburnea TaxID=1346889 RepID=A0A9X9XC08_9PROT|nr:hypothetical protein [Neoroseomonas eburnea]MBR0681244.1 hypothetical protein [Neoroseomonas eburnea]